MADFDHKLYGKYKAFVRDTNDPEKRGRIRCFCPQVMGDEDGPNSWLWWAEACLPYAGGGTALDFAVPLSKADLGHESPVWVEFEGGSADHPIWVGSGVYAPTTKDPSLTKSAVSDQAGMVGVGLVADVASAGPGSTEGSLNPPYFAPDQKDKGMTAKADERLVFLVEGGGSIVFDGGCIDIQAPMLRLNGRLIIPSVDEIVG